MSRRRMLIVILLVIGVVILFTTTGLGGALERWLLAMHGVREH